MVPNSKYVVREISRGALIVIIIVVLLGVLGTVVAIRLASPMNMPSLQTTSSALAMPPSSQTTESLASLNGATSASTQNCIFSNQTEEIPQPQNLSFEGCLVPGEVGAYVLTIQSPMGLTLGGSITAESALNATIVGGRFVLYTNDDSTVMSFSGLYLSQGEEYTITLRNDARVNNTIDLSLQLS